jgi:hypothetical protein
MVDINIAPWKVVKEVYDMCLPVGAGFLQYTPDKMTEEQAKEYVTRFTSTENEIHMDYVGGRQCKFSMKISFGYIVEFDDEEWFDHTPLELKYLISKLKVMATNEAAANK